MGDRYRAQRDTSASTGSARVHSTHPRGNDRCDHSRESANSVRRQRQTGECQRTHEPDRHRRRARRRRQSRPAQLRPNREGRARRIIGGTASGWMTRAFFIVGPTATGKSEIAADVAREVGAEIVSADAFQIYRGLDLLTAKPEASTLGKAPHHLISTVPVTEEMNAEKFRRAATCVMEEINSRGKLAIVVGGTGLYIKALTHGLAPVPECDPKLREKLNAMSLDHLRSQLAEVDPEAARKIDLKNRRRLVRALEICLLTGKTLSVQRARGSASHSEAATGVFLFRDRQELYERIK